MDNLRRFLPGRTVLLDTILWFAGGGVWNGSFRVNVIPRCV